MTTTQPTSRYAENPDGRLGVLFVGAGMAAELHQRALTLGSSGYLVGVVDPQNSLAERRAADWACVAFDSYAQALADPRVTAVFILSPADTHEALALTALRAGKPVLIEKPVTSAEGIKRLAEESSQRGLVCMPAHNYAYQPEFTQLRQLVQDGSFGTVRAAWITYAIQHPEEVAKHYGGVLEEVMIHHTYLGVALFGVPTAVYAGCMEPAWMSMTQEDQAWMTWHYPKGMSLHLFASFAVDDETTDSWTFVVKVLGTEGGGGYSWRSALFRRPLGSLGFAIPAYENSYVHEQQAFFAALHGATTSIVSTLDQAYQTAMILRAAAESHRTSAAVKITDL